ncbi:MAG: DNA polymerase III subunit beta [bacterium]|nr:MAG: DNA polymerase III subunit beta [bacterium]
MKLTVLQENLQRAVTLSSHFVSSKAQLPILSNILLRASKSRLILSATNLETSITTSIPVKMEGEGEITVNGKTFNDLVLNLSSGSIDLEIDKEQLKISSNKFKSNILGSNTADFPTLPYEVGKNTIKLRSKDFAKALSKSLFAVSNDETRPILTGVLFIFSENELKLVSTDGFRLTETKIKLETKQKDFKIIIPKAILNEISKVDEEEISMSWDKENNQVVFGFGDTILSSRVIEGEFPDYEKIIPQSSICELIIDKEEIEKAIKTASVFARESGNIIKLQIKKETLKITAESSASGNQETEIEIKTEELKQEAIDVMFNFRFLEEFLKIVEADEIKMFVSDNNKASKFLDPKSPNLIHIIMPIKTN